MVTDIFHGEDSNQGVQIFAWLDSRCIQNFEQIIFLGDHHQTRQLKHLVHFEFISSHYFLPSHCRKHVWGNFCLSFGNEKLVDDGARLQDFGIRNNDEVCYLGLRLTIAHCPNSLTYFVNS